jgi:ribosomal protein L12E/L44/L45/RPP1/RPP2
MKHLAAYLLLQLSNPHPTKQDVTDLLATVGIEPKQDRLDALFSMLEGKDINEVSSHPFLCHRLPFSRLSRTI